MDFHWVFTTLRARVEDQEHTIREFDEALAATRMRCEELRQAAEALWGLLDDISTAGDVAKSDDKLFRGLAERYCERRSEWGESDGYTISIRAKLEKGE